MRNMPIELSNSNHSLVECSLMETVNSLELLTCPSPTWNGLQHLENYNLEVAGGNQALMKGNCEKGNMCKVLVYLLHVFAMI